MTCSCSKRLTERTVAVEFRVLGGLTIVEKSRQALVCDDCGVVAWDPPQPATNQSRPYTPYTPWIPATLPYTGPNVSPNTYPPYPRLPYTTCGVSADLGRQLVNDMTARIVN